jgi:hypothetical protein
MHFNMPSASRRFSAEVVPMNAGLAALDAKACFDDEKAPPTERRYQAGESLAWQARRTKVFALEVRISGKWGSNHGQCRPR